jgi:hypothetical protein
VETSTGEFYGVGPGFGAGPYYRGGIFKVPAGGGSYTVLVDFAGAGSPNLGTTPVGDLALGPDGFFYGTTSSGGTTGFGRSSR